MPISRKKDCVEIRDNAGTTNSDFFQSTASKNSLKSWGQTQNEGRQTWRIRKLQEMGFHMR